MPDAPKNTVPRQSQKPLSWRQKILLAVFGAYLAEKLFGILTPSLPHVSIPHPRRARRHRRTMPMTTNCRTAANTKRMTRIFPQRILGTHRTTMRMPIPTAAAPRTAGNTARTRTSSTMTGTITARGMTTIISTTETLSRVRCVSVSAYTKGVFLCPQRQQMILRRAAIVSPTS